MADQRFRFGPLEKRGLLLGLSLGQLVTLTTGAGVAVIATAVAAGPAGIGVAMLALVAAAVAAFMPVAGQTAVEWLPVAAGSVLSLTTRGRMHLARAPQEGRRLEGDGGGVCDPPPALRGCRVVGSWDEDLGDVGIVEDPLCGTATAVLRVRATGFALLDDHERDRRLAWWGCLLEWLCRDTSHIHRLQWCERSHPATSPPTVDDATAADAVRRSYGNLVRGATGSIQRHECLLAVTLSARRSARAIRATKLAGHRFAAAAILRRELRPLIDRLRGSDFDAVDVLDRWAVAAALRRAIDVDPSGHTRGAEDMAPSSPWPLSTLTSWSSYRTDATHQATFWISEWPRTEVGPDFLAPLLLQTTVRRTVSMTMAFDPPGRAQREAEAALTADLADEELRRRAGFLVGFRRRREQENVVRRGEEIAAGHGSVRFSGYVTVTAGTSDALDRACAEIEQQAQQARLELRRLFGQQDVGFTYTLPLGRGLR